VGASREYDNPRVFLSFIGHHADTGHCGGAQSFQGGPHIRQSELSVTITHTVSDPTSHYVKTVTVMSNGKVVQTMTYSSQPAADTFTYTYTVDAAPGTELSAQASCNYFGSDTGTVTVP
jgi:hypothetical protein